MLGDFIHSSGHRQHPCVLLKHPKHPQLDTRVGGNVIGQVPELVPEEQLPLTLPETDDFLPDGSARSPLAKIRDWLEFTDPVSGKRYVRETSTMPQWAGSCW